MGRIEKLTLYSLILLLIWGNMVSGLGAGLACPDWPLCFGSFFPEINFPIFMEHGHRVLGLFVTIFFAFLAKERLTFYKVDITKRYQVKSTIHKIHRKFKKIDCLINNAGINPKMSLKSTKFENFSLE